MTFPLIRFGRLVGAASCTPECPTAGTAEDSEALRPSKRICERPDDGEDERVLVLSDTPDTNSRPQILVSD